MAEPPLDSVVPVQSAQPSKQAFGTAYVVKHRDDRTYVVTCAHVVEAVGGAGQLLVDQRPARVEESGAPDGADDVAVLSTERLAAPALPLAFDAERGRPVSVVGFGPILRGARVLARDPIEATLDSEMQLVGPQGSYAAWQLRSHRPVTDGYSGSPIVDKVTGEVLAIAVYRRDEQRAIAISPDVLRTLWPDGLRDLVATRATLGGIVFVYVPTSTFEMGTPARRAAEFAEHAHRDSYLAEAPQHRVTVAGCYISRLPITNRQYAEFVAATRHRLPHRPDPLSLPYSWDHATGSYPEGKADLPVVLVSWEDARAYCRWRGVRLPTEAEWEKAATGGTRRTWPWGDDWDPDRANTLEGGREVCLPAGQLSPAGDSPYGIADMSGNVWEWCSSVFDDYPYQADDGREDPNAFGDRVIRGGAWGNSRWDARCAAREHRPPDDYGFTIGFRVALSRDVPALAEQE